VAIKVALRLAAGGIPAEIINADAMQLYAGMDIGTAKVPESQRHGVVHRLLDIWPVSKEASVADYQTLARQSITDCHDRAVVPVLVGGSGLYVSSVLYEFEFPGTDPEIREALEKRLQREGVEALVAELRLKDPEAGDAIDPRNSRRIVRALEVIQITGKPFGSGLHARSTLWREPVLVVGLQRDRAALSHALEQRVRKMWEAGLVAEVEGLMESSEPLGVTASQAIGYRQAMDYLAGSMSQEEAVAETVSLTKRYARRQMSWFRRDPHVSWRDVDQVDADTLVDEVVTWISSVR
jgi:tRNA dimethylallyltransferase